MTTTHLKLPEIAASQSQKHVTHNEALFFLDSLVQLSVIDKDLTTPPASPSTGDRYIVASGATGDWTGKGNSVATYDGSGWVFMTPNDGWFAWVDDENVLYVFDGGWSTLAGILGAGYLPLAGGTLTGNLVLEEATPSLRLNDTDVSGYTLLQTADEVVQLSVDAGDNDAGSSFDVLIDGAGQNFRVNEHGVGIGGASADATNGFAFFGTNVLFNSSSGISQVFNKNAAADDASFTFQQGFTTHAQMGLLGNNNWTLKVGTSFLSALTVNTTNGNIGIGTTSPARKFEVVGGAGDTIPLRLESGSSTPDAYIDIKSSTTTADFKVRIGASTDHFTAWAGGFERLRLTDSGNCGIGTTTPSTKLQISDAVSSYLSVGRTSAPTSAVFLGAEVNSTVLYSRSSFGSAGNMPFRIVIGTTEVIRVNSSYNVGIGTSSPLGKLTISEATGGTGMEFYPSSSGNSVSHYDRGTPAYVTWTQRASQFIWAIGGTERMRLNGSGDLGIGTSSPGEKLDVAGKARAQTLNLSSLPTSSAGLSSGDVWNDSGTLKIA